MSHDHHHDHAHEHSHAHDHAHAQVHHHHHHGHHAHHTHGSRPGNVLFAACLNLGFTIIELIGGLLTNSVAVLSDALHDLGDSFALFGAYIAERQAERPADAKRTFGYARLSLISALVSAVILIVGSVFILIEAVERLFNPEPVEALWVAGLAVFGIITNFIAYKKLHGGASANEKVLSWHLLEDVLGWVAVLIGSLIMYVSGLFVIDALLTIGFAGFILWGVVRNLKEVINLFMQGVPADINLQQLKHELCDIAGISSVHDIHVWSLDGARHIFTGHVVLTEGVTDTTEQYNQIRTVLKKYQIDHTTVEFEHEGSDDCHGDRCDH
ncbi:MAG TPA: cation diffusion facilitator family transporter [Candidatus Paceibacterota bacterium]